MTISEIVSKNRRGRPPAFAPEFIAALRPIFPSVSTKRGIQNIAYRTRAHELLQNDPAFSYLIDRVPAMRGNKTAFKSTILSELGRLDNDNDLRKAAKWVCEQKPTSRKAVAVLRRFRTGKTSNSDALNLTNVLIGAVNAYRDNHPGTTRQQVLAALKNVGDAMEATELGTPVAT